MVEHDQIWTLKKILGYSNIQMTEKYAHLSKKAQFVPEFNWEGGEIKPLRIPSPGFVKMI